MSKIILKAFPERIEMSFKSKLEKEPAILKEEDLQSIKEKLVQKIPAIPLIDIREKTSHISFIEFSEISERPLKSLYTIEKLGIEFLESLYTIKIEFLGTVKHEIDTSKKMEQIMVIKKMRERVESRQILSFDDLKKIKEALESTDDETTLKDVLILLGEDIELRKEKFGVDCIKELYRGEDSLPSHLRTPKPDPNNIKELINERMKAIILHEYSRLHDEDTMKFIDGKITYHECIKRTKGYMALAHKLFPRS